MKNLFTILISLLLCAPLAGAYAQCSGQYTQTYPSGSTTASTNTNNGSGTASATYCPLAPGTTQVLSVHSASTSSVTLQSTIGTTVTNQGPVTVLAGTTYNFTLAATTSQAVHQLSSTIACNNPKPQTFTLTLAPTLTLDASAITVCQGGSSTLSATGSSSGSYTWSAPGMATVTNTGTLTVSPTATTTYTVTAPTSCGTNTQQQLTVLVPTLTATSTASAVCPGTSVTFTAASNEAGTTFTWSDVGTGTSVGTGSPLTLTPSATTTYRLTSSNPSGCSNTSTRDFPVTVASQTLTITPAAPSIVLGSSVTMTAASNLSGATYTWRTGGSGGTVVGNSASLTVSPITTTTYTASSSAGGCTTSRNATVTVSSGQPLPVELVSFEARWTSAGPVLTWTTASELNNKYFQIERSFDSREFKAIGQVAGAGNSSVPTAYRYQDTEALQSLGTTLYYRLGQVDASGKIQYSVVKTVRNNGKSVGLVASVYPNPFDKAATLRFETTQAGPVVCTMHDLVGRPVLVHTFSASAGFQQLALPALATSQPGLYYLTVQQGEQQQVIRLQQQ